MRPVTLRYNIGLGVFAIPTTPYRYPLQELPE
jgi:hypothetical protein